MKFTLILIALALAGCKEAAPPARTDRPALTMVVGATAHETGRLYSGEVRARHELNLGFRISGKIVTRLVDVGDRVKAGQLLARLDPADAGLQAGAAKAQSLLAEADLKRYRELRSKGFVSQSALDAKQAAFDAADAQAGLSKHQSDYTALFAEHDGVIAATLAEAGQVVSAGQTVLRVAQAGEREVAIEIPESEWASRHVGDVAVVTVAGERIEGRLRELSQVADPASRTYSARVAFGGTSAALGMTAGVRFDGKSGTSELLIPLSAIYQQQKQTAVWIVGKDNSVGLREVKVAAYRDDGALISAGLNPGERIVSAGVHRLSPGEKIRAIDAGAAR